VTTLLITHSFCRDERWTYMYRVDHVATAVAATAIPSLVTAGGWLVATGLH